MAVLTALLICRKPRSRFCRVALIAFVLAFLKGTDLPAQPPIPSEYQVKAVFLFRFAQFVDWPTNTFPADDSPLVIGIVGDDPFGAYLDETVRGETVNNRSLVVKHFRSAESVKDCQVLFVSRTGAGRPEQILSRLKGRSILTVGDTDDFTRIGGMIRFAIENNKLRLKINLAAAKAASLTIRSKLLRLADITTSEKN